MSANAAVIEELSLSGDLFGLDEAVFTGILRNSMHDAVVKQVEQMDSLNKDYYGGRGEKAVVKLHYTHAGRDYETELFIKRHCQRNPNEAQHYKYLTRFKAPIPRLYAYYSGEDRQDIIVTEVVRPFYVDDEPNFMLDREIFQPFLETTALFNSVQISDEYKGLIAGDYDLLKDKVRPFHGKLKSMFDAIESDLIYSGLRKKVTSQMQAWLLDLLKGSCDSIEKMEKGLYHWDHKPRNLGWSDIQQKYVLFDLEDTLWGPRFYNIGMWLGGEDKDEGKYSPREELAEHYLSLYNQDRRERVSVDCLLQESHPLWIAYKIECLLVFFYESGAKPYRLRNRIPQEYKSEMEGKFIDLINLLCNLKGC